MSYHVFGGGGGGGTGDVTGPSSSTDNAVVRYDGTTGKLIQDSGVTIDDSDNVTIPGDLTVNGTTTTINTATLDVTDANITVNNGGNQSSADSNDAGITVEMSDATDAIVHYDSTSSSNWKIGLVGSSVDIADISSTQTFTNKTLTSPTINVLDSSLTIQDNLDATKQLRFEASGISTGTTRTLTAPNADDTIAVLAATQTLTNKTLDSTNAVTLLDSNFTLQDNGDATKQAAFELSGITTATTRTFTLPDISDTLVTLTAAQSLTNKTLDNTNSATLSDVNFTLQDNADATKQAVFELSGITTATTRTFTLPDVSDTLVTLAATQTLTNKTITIADTALTLQDDGDATKQLNFELSGITTATTRTLTVPDADDTLVVLAASQTLTNKTVVVANNTITTAASGNLTSTELNAALAELQTDIDTRAVIADVFSTNSTSGTASLTANETYIVNTSGGTATLTLPAPSADVFVRVKDSGSAETNNITINPNGAETIDGASSLVIDSNYGSAVLVSDGTNWYIL